MFKKVDNDMAANALAEALDCVWLFLHDCIEQNMYLTEKAAEELREMETKCFQIACPCLAPAGHTIALLDENGMPCRQILRWPYLRRVWPSYQRWLPHLGHNMPRETGENVWLRAETDLHGGIERVTQSLWIQVDMNDENRIEELKLEHRQAKADVGSVLRKLDHIRAQDKNAMRATRCLATLKDILVFLKPYNNCSHIHTYSYAVLYG